MADGDERFDALLMNMAQTQHGIEPLLDSVFSFLRRKTDFFSGAPKDQVENTVLQSVRKQAAIFEKEQYHKKQQVAPPKPVKETPRFEEVQEATPKGNESMPKGTESSGKDNEEEEEAGLTGNGGRTEKYTWTQTLQEVQMSFDVPSGTKGRQVDVDIKAGKLRVGLKGSDVLVDGNLHKRVKTEDSFWTIEDGTKLCIYLQKENQMEWWKCVMEGDAEIDTSKVQPENSNLSDLDADTRKTVEKMMFDQRQKAQGLPTSDEMQKQEMLQKFMSQHPEMDFSNAKVG